MAEKKTAAETGAEDRTPAAATDTATDAAAAMTAAGDADPAARCDRNDPTLTGREAVEKALARAAGAEG